MKDKLRIKLLRLHMNCNIDYINGHAVIAGMLANKRLKSFNTYVNECSKYGVVSFELTALHYFKLVKEEQEILCETANDKIKVFTKVLFKYKGLIIQISTYINDEIEYVIINPTINKDVKLEGAAKELVVNMFQATDEFKTYQKRLLTFLNE